MVEQDHSNPNVQKPTNPSTILPPRASPPLHKKGRAAYNFVDSTYRIDRKWQKKSLPPTSTDPSELTSLLCDLGGPKYDAIRCRVAVHRATSSFLLRNTPFSRCYDSALSAGSWS